MAVPSAKHTLLMKTGTEDGHRASCHRCGNLRKRNVKCSECPHIFCQVGSFAPHVEFLPLALANNVKSFILSVVRKKCLLNGDRKNSKKVAPFASFTAAAKIIEVCHFVFVLILLEPTTLRMPHADTTKCNRMFHCYKKCAAVKNGGGEDAFVSTKVPVMTIEEAAPIVSG